MEYENIFPKLSWVVRIIITLFMFWVWSRLCDAIATLILLVLFIAIRDVIIPILGIHEDVVIAFLRVVPVSLLVLVGAAYLAYKVTKLFIRRLLIPHFLLIPK